MKKTLPFLLVLILPLCFSFQIIGKDVLHSHSDKPTGQIAVIDSTDWAVLKHQKYVLVNNVYNKAIAPSPLKQSVFLEKINGKEIPGWQWACPISPDIVSFPSICYGNSPWETVPPRSYGMPLRIGSKRIITQFDINLKAYGVYRMTFLMWVVSSLPPTNQKITHDIFITIANHNMAPSADRIGQVVVGGHHFDVISTHYIHATGPATPIRFVEFIAREPLLQGTLDLTDFTDYLAEQGLLTKGTWITDVEFGTHVVGGSGLVELKNYRIDIR